MLLERVDIDGPMPLMGKVMLVLRVVWEDLLIARGDGVF